MSFAQIKAVASEGKTADYGIKVGDTIAVNDSINAEVISIGSDYIEFMTIESVVDYDSSQDVVFNVGGKNVTCYKSASFYVEPQVNYTGKSNTAIVCYIDSDIQAKVNAWFESQDNTFKSSVKETQRIYESAFLSFNGTTYTQDANCNSIAENEKVYIPTKTELENIYKVSTNHNDNWFWTATPYAFFNSSDHGDSFGHFYFGNRGNILAGNGYGIGKACAMFRIG